HLRARERRPDRERAVGDDDVAGRQPLHDVGLIADGRPDFRVAASELRAALAVGLRDEDHALSLEDLYGVLRYGHPRSGRRRLDAHGDEHFGTQLLAWICD